jgi:hypothetical protein
MVAFQVYRNGRATHGSKRIHFVEGALEVNKAALDGDSRWLDKFCD